MTQFLLTTSLAVSEAIQCFSCLSNEQTGKSCRRISEATIANCQGDVTFCTALVFLKNGQVHVNRGCGGDVASWGLGDSECQIMSSDALMDVAMALYQCRADGCNNIEPADGSQSSDVVLLTKSVKQTQPSSSLKHSSSSSASSTNVARGMSASSHSGSSFMGVGKMSEKIKSPAVNEKKLLSGGEEEVEVRVTKKQIKLTTPRATAKTTMKTTTMQEEDQEVEALADEEEVKTTKSKGRIVTESKATTGRPSSSKKTTSATTQAEEDEEENEAPAYAKAVTTSTTTTKRRIAYPDNDLEFKERIVTEKPFKMTRPSARARTVFDRRR